MGRRGGGWGGAGHGAADCLVLVGAELLDIIPVETTGTEAGDGSEVNTLIVSPAGAGVSEAPILHNTLKLLAVIILCRCC